jgi:hypothetical protein
MYRFYRSIVWQVEGCGFTVRWERRYALAMRLVQTLAEWGSGCGWMGVGAKGYK